MRFIKKFSTVLLLCIVISGPASGMYSWTDENSVRHFRDRPPLKVLPER